MTIEQDLIEIIGQYPSISGCLPGPSIESLGNHGGFSGIELFRLQTQSGPKLIRRHPPLDKEYVDRLRGIHQLISHCVSLDCRFLASSEKSAAGEILVWSNQRYWQIENWIEGEANYWHEPSTEKYEQIFSALARFHSVAAQFQSSHGPSPAVESRIRRIAQLNRITTETIHQRLESNPNRMQQELGVLALQVCGLFHRLKTKVERELGALRSNTFRLTPCFRDIWHDHLLFVGDRLNGIVDYGAVNIDNIAADVSRLSVSLTQDNPSGFRKAFDVYSEVKNLSQSEIQLGMALNHSNILLSSMNWVDWVYCQERQFESIEPIRDRISRNIIHMHFLENST